ncbi:replication initiation negative regulator SeqA [Algicola sagamiensis]|uniref:replication initiation negative regulator SeqA n=1 Tax=Algicola sagamiensis TaxID=163869 RepID=UPI00047547CD|nr:replication initiation negative regulator SeqA [Algicola sagamiensis]
MKTIEVDEELYQHIAGKTEKIGESASEILRRLLGLTPHRLPQTQIQKGTEATPKVSINQDELCVFDVLNVEELNLQKGVVGRFLFILGALAKVHREKFDCVLDIKGRNRLYFAANEATLLESGSSTNPKQIPDSKYWVITNSNTTKKKSMLTDVAIALGYTPAEVEKIREML